jgi:DNA ligase-1
MKFHQLAQLFDDIEEASGRLHITQLLAQLFDRATPEEAQVISYLSLGRLRAVYKGTKFSFALKGMVHVLCDVLHVDEALLRTSWKELGDLGAVLEQYSDHTGDDRDLLSVYEQLVYFEQISGAGSYEEKRSYLYNLPSSVSSKSAKYIVRMILGKLRLGFSDMTIIDALSWYLVDNKSLHKQIEHAYNMCADIGSISYVLKRHGIAGLDEIAMTVGVPVRPAAAERLPDAASIVEKIGPCVAQPKLDGFRLQIHIDRDHYGANNRCIPD